MFYIAALYSSKLSKPMSLSTTAALQKNLDELQAVFSKSVSCLTAIRALVRGMLRLAFLKIKSISREASSKKQQGPRASAVNVTGVSGFSTQSTPKSKKTKNVFSKFEGTLPKRRLSTSKAFSESIKEGLAKISEFSYMTPTTKFSTSPRLPKPSLSCSPGPGAYRPSDYLVANHHPNYSIFGRRKAHKRRDEVPGPGAYDPTIHATSRHK